MVRSVLGAYPRFSLKKVVLWGGGFVAVRGRFGLIGTPFALACGGWEDPRREEESIFVRWPARSPPRGSFSPHRSVHARRLRGGSRDDAGRVPSRTGDVAGREPLCSDGAARASARHGGERVRRAGRSHEDRERCDRGNGG